MLTTRQAADRLGAGESSVRLWASQGKFPGAHIVEPPAGVPYWLIPERALEGFRMGKAGRPRKKAGSGVRPGASSATTSKKGE